MSEPELIERARQGDEAAWETLVRQHQEATFRLAYLILGDAGDAEDVAQEAFIRAFRALDRFDTDRPLRPWLLSITANLARNRRRSLGRYLAALRRAFQSEATREDAARALEEAYTRRREAETLWRAVRRLREQEQEIIYLRFFLELSVEETAQVLKVAPGTVKSRLHRAVARLRRVIEDEFPTLREERVA